MKDRTKEIIRDGFGSLISNASALRGAKAGPLWLTIVMFFLALIIPIIPIFVSQATTNGSSFLTSYSYGLERYVTSIAMDLKTNRLAEFSISEDHLLTIKEDGNEVDFNNYGSTTPYATYKNDAKNQYDFVVYLSTATTDKEKSTVNEEIAKIRYGLKTTEVLYSEENVYRPSYMIIFKNGVFVSIYANNGTKNLTSSYNGDFKTIEAGNNYLTTFLTVKDGDGNEIAPSMINDDYTNGVYNNFKKFLDKSYETLKIRNMWVTSAIYFGIFFGVSFMMGLIMFLLTRGKNNPNNYFSLWLCLKIQGRLSFCPGLITMVVGWFLTSQIPLFFIMLVGLRVMWISMKELRPIAQ